MHFIEIQNLSVFLLPDAIGSQQRFCLKSCSFTIKKLKLFPGVTYIPKEISYSHQQGAPDAPLVNNFKLLNKLEGYAYSRNSDILRFLAYMTKLLKSKRPKNCFELLKHKIFIIVKIKLGEDGQNYRFKNKVATLGLLNKCIMLKLSNARGSI